MQGDRLSVRSSVEPDDLWCNTWSGVQFFPFRPTAEMVKASDIAHALSNQTRYFGHGESFYSVAEHSVSVALAVELLGGSEAEQLWGLLHDASEAYVGDLAAPIKRHLLLAGYREVEQRVQNAVAVYFGLPPEMPAIVKHADYQLLAIESPILMPRQPAPWGLPPIDELLRNKIEVQWLSPPEAKIAFIGRLRSLWKDPQEYLPVLPAPPVISEVSDDDDGD